MKNVVSLSLSNTFTSIELHIHLHERYNHIAIHRLPSSTTNRRYHYVQPHQHLNKREKEKLGKIKDGCMWEVVFDISKPRVRDKWIFSRDSLSSSMFPQYTLFGIGFRDRRYSLKKDPYVICFFKTDGSYLTNFILFSSTFFFSYTHRLGEKIIL